MPQNKDFALRIEIIDECLRNPYKKWTLKKLIDTVNEKLGDQYGKTISKRTIQEDIKYLKLDRLAPIEKKKSGNETYFYYSDSNYSIKNLPISVEEIGYLNDAISILKQVNNFRILQDVDEVINKLKNRIDTNIERDISFIQFEKHTLADGTDFIDDLFVAIREKIALRISYKPFKLNEPISCLFHPYLLKEFRNRWFLIGRRNNDNHVTNFALDRIMQIKNSNDKYVDNDLFDPKTYFDNLIGVSIPKGELPQHIKIKIFANQAPYVKTKPIHFSQEVKKELRNGDIIIEVFLIANYELRSVLLSFGADMEVLSPANLRQEIIDINTNSLKNYE